jgi:hypothetical protein
MDMTFIARIPLLLSLALAAGTPALAQPARQPGAVAQPAVASPAAAEAALRRVIGELQRGAPDYSRMSPDLAEATRQQLSAIKGILAQLGPLKSVTFRSVDPNGANTFVAAFEKGSTEWKIVLGQGGRIETLWFGPVS